MNIDPFQDELRLLLRARPFVPFAIVMTDDRIIVIDEPAVAFNGGAASFIDSHGDIQFIQCEQVQDFKPLVSTSHGENGSSETSIHARRRMTVTQFEQKMRAFLRQEPFEPFVVQTNRDDLIVIDNPQAVALAAGGAGYIGPTEIKFIESDDVIEIRSVKEQIAT